MSCETNKKKFASDLKNNILDANWEALQVKSKLNTNTAKPISYSDRQVVFIPFDANNPNTDVVFGKIKNLVSQINENYQNEFGISNTVSYNKLRDGYEINIHPSQKLIDAINIQFNNEELNTFNSRYQVKEGVSELFESNSELANVGTQEQYSQYLDTIFPDSKVKDIVYHGSPEKIEVFDKSKLGINTGSESAKNAFFFASNPFTSFIYTWKTWDLGQDESSGSMEYAAIYQIGKFVERFNEKTSLKELLSDKEVQSISSNNVYLSLLERLKKFDVSNKKESVFFPISKNQTIRFDKDYSNKTKGVFTITTQGVGEENFFGIKEKEEVISEKEFDNLVKKGIEYLESIKPDIKIYQIILNSQNPLIVDDKNQGFRQETYAERVNKAKKEKNDSVIINNTADPVPYSDIYAVFEPEQIHILGSKQDIQGFKEFISNNNNSEFNSRYSNRQEDESIPNNQQPIGDNYVEFVRYKKAQLEDIEKNINYLKNKLRNKDDSNNRTKLKEYYSLQQEVNNQLEILSTNQVDYMFHAIIEDLQAIKYALDSNAYHNVVEVSNKLNWYKDFIPNLDLNEHEDFNGISGLLNSITKTYNDKIREKALKMLEDEEQTQFLLKVQNEGKSEDEKITVEDLVKVSKDIDWLDLTFFGLKTDTTDNTIIPQFLLYKHNQIIKKIQADMLELHDRLDAVIERNKMTDFDWVFSKDSKGNKDGFLIDLFSEKWYAADSIREQKLSQYQNSLFDTNIDTKTTYTNVINWYKENTIVIDFTRLNVVKEKYGSLYPEYFTYNDNSISAYEENIKKQLGPRYEDTISKILDKLQKFEELKTNDKSEFKERNIASHNVWEFLKSYKNGFPGQIEYTYGEDNKTGKVYYNPIALNDLQFLPESKITKVITTDTQRKEEKVDTGFYSEEFQNILSDNAKVEYWTVLKDMSEFIKNSYQLNSSGRLEYPKINKRLSERAIENLKSLQANRKAFGVVGKTFTSYLHEYKSMFYGDSKDKNYEENKVVSTYIDSSSKEIKDKVRILMLKSGGKLKYKEALEQARAEVLPNYSSDINTLFKAMTAEAAMHEARVEMQPIAQSMIEYFRTITIPDGSKDGKVRKNAVNKLETYYKSIILNQNLDNTNTIVGKPNKHLKKLKITKLYSDAEKSLMKDLGVILEEGLQDNLKLKSNESVLEETVKNDNGTTTISIINNSTGKIRKEILDSKGNLFNMKDSIEGKDYTFQAIINNGEILYNANGQIVDFKTFNQKVKDYIQDKIDNLGQDTTLAGVTDGILKTIIWNSLAFSPTSGIFNRMEGKHSAMLMDLTGEYWTPGNIDIANQMMAFSNIKKIALERLPKDMQGAKQQVEIFDLLVKRLDVLQDRKNELQKNVSKTSWSNIINPFKWAVDNPEFKNQGAIMLAILMDTKINGIPLLNKETGKFEAFYIQDGVLKLKPEFEGLIDFGSQEFSTLTSKMVDAISHSQGDYDINDIKKYKTTLAGRASTLFLTFMPEHINQRWGVVGDNSYNYFTGKKKRNGRYITAAKANPVNFVSYWLMTGAITYGSLGLVATAGVGVLGTYLLASRFKALSKNKNRDIHYIQEFIGLLQHIVAETLNYPSRMLNLKKGKIGNSVFLAGDLLQGNNLTPEEIGAIQSMARELAFMLNALLIKFAIAALMYDDDDDRESQIRLYHNFMQNQLSRSITSLSTFTNPDAFMKDNTRVAFLSQLANISQLIAYGFNGKEDETSKILGTTARIFGMPNTINRALFEGTMPWESKTNYDELSFEYTKSIKPLSWFPKYVKDEATDGEYSSKKDYEQIRKDLREELRSEYMDKVNGNADALEKVTNIIIERKIGHKNKGASYKETLKDLEDGSISNKKKSSKSLKKQKESLKEILKEADLSNSEIGNIMRKVYATKKDSNKR